MNYTMRERKNRILIFDFGSQYTQLISRRMRELKIENQVVQANITREEVISINPSGIILSGGPESVNSLELFYVPKIIFDINVPILGICYGMQFLVKNLGGVVSSSSKKEFGLTKILVEQENKLFNDSPKEQRVWMSHGDSITETGDNFKCIARSSDNIISAVMHKNNIWFGIQYHPEVTHSPYGKQLLKNFAVEICKCYPSLNTKSVIGDMVNVIKNKVKKSEKVILALSGGLDSSVTALILSKAVKKEQLFFVMIDSGLLRINECQNVVKKFHRMGIHVEIINAQEKFLSRLCGISDPEKKRKIIGETFIETFFEVSKKIGHVTWLSQGTIYSDVIESSNASGKSRVIKSHHNVGGLPRNNPFKLIEPLKYMFKDEVRSLAVELTLPEEMVCQHPFPGTGLGTRILGKIKKEYINILQEVDYIFIKTLKEYKWYNRVSQAFCVFIPVKSVGVRGDQRIYEYVISLRCIESKDFMTANWSFLPHKLIQKISLRITNHVKSISRVVYDVTSKPPSTVEWE